MHSYCVSLLCICIRYCLLLFVDNEFLYKSSLIVSMSSLTVSCARLVLFLVTVAVTSVKAMCLLWQYMNSCNFDALKCMCNEKIGVD